MAVTNTPDKSEKLAICERLRVVESSANDFIGDPDPKYVTCWHRNPDGPQAADTIEALYEALEGLAIMAGKLVVRADGKFRPERRAVLDAMIIAETALSRARNGGQP